MRMSEKTRDTAEELHAPNDTRLSLPLKLDMVDRLTRSAEVKRCPTFCASSFGSCAISSYTKSGRGAMHTHLQSLANDARRYSHRLALLVGKNLTSMRKESGSEVELEGVICVDGRCELGRRRERRRGRE